jgi:hypothetical protein
LCRIVFPYFTVYDIALEQHYGIKPKCKSDNEANKSCKVMTLDEKIKILDKLRGGMSAAAVGLTFRWHFILKYYFTFIFYLMLNFPMILYYVTQFVHK